MCSPCCTLPFSFSLFWCCYNYICTHFARLRLFLDMDGAFLVLQLAFVFDYSMQVRHVSLFFFLVFCLLVDRRQHGW